MKRSSKILGLIVIGSIAFAFTLFFLITSDKKEKTELILYGNVDIRQVDLGFRVSGRVEKLFFDEGDHVTTGQEMAALDKNPYKEELLQAQARVEEIQNSLLNAKSQFSRREQVVGSAAISKEDFESSFFNQEELKANLKEAMASLGIADIRYQDTEIHCPSNGTILTRIREPGSIVNVGDPVFSLSLDSPVWIRAYISEPNLGKIYPGMRAEVFTDSFPDKPYQGYIGFISPTAEFTPKNVETTDLRTDLVYRLRIIVENPNLELRQGMPVTVQIRLQQSPETSSPH